MFALVYYATGLDKDVDSYQGMVHVLSYPSRKTTGRCGRCGVVSTSLENRLIRQSCALMLEDRRLLGGA